MEIISSKTLTSRADDIVATTGNRDVLIRHVDLLSLRSVREFAAGVLASERRLDVLVNNAGAGGLPHKYTEDGIVMGMQANHFGPFLLTCLLLGRYGALLRSRHNRRFLPE